MLTYKIHAKPIFMYDVGKEEENVPSSECIGGKQEIEIFWLQCHKIKSAQVPIYSNFSSLSEFGGELEQKTIFGEESRQEIS